MMELATNQVVFFAIGSLIFGLILLVKGGDLAIDSAVYLAEKMGMSHLVIGFTIIAFGTSLPELIVSVNANLAGYPEMSAGNVLGSNIANILLVGGASALIAPLVFSSHKITLQIFVMIAASILLTGLILFGEVSRPIGGAMIALLLLYVYYEYVQVKKGNESTEEIEEPNFSSIWQALPLLFIGFAMVALGAEFMVDSAQVLAKIMGIPEAVIALTIFALGTSLPELSTCIIAMRKRHTDIVLGNIVGSNVFNILMIMGGVAITKPIVQGSFSGQIAEIDVWITLAVTMIFSTIMLFLRKVNKPIGVAFITLYIAYVIGLYLIYMI